MNLGGSIFWFFFGTCGGFGVVGDIGGGSGFVSLSI